MTINIFTVAEQLQQDKILLLPLILKFNQGIIFPEHHGTNTDV